MPRFLKAVPLTLTFAAVMVIAGCDKNHKDADKDDRPAAGAMTDADAATITDATVATWQSMDAAKIDALYAPDVVGFDVDAPPLSTDRANWTKLQQAFAAAKYDHVAVTQSKTQILDSNNFVFSTVANLTSSAGPAKAATIRCTDVFHKQTDGKFLIANEHCSRMPGTKA